MELVRVDSRACKEVAHFLDSECPSISKARKHIGEEKLHLLLSSYFLQFIDYIGVKSQFTPSHVEVLVRDLCDEFYNLKVSEVAFVLKQARLGKFGELYNNINPVKIMAWFQMYRERRLEVAGEISAIKSDTIKKVTKHERGPMFSEGQRLGKVAEVISKIGKTNEDS